MNESDTCTSGTERWVCPNCEGAWRGESPPDPCPVDATPQSDFIPIEEWDKPHPDDVEVVDDSIPTPWGESDKGPVRRSCEFGGCERAAVYRAYVGVQDGSEDEKIVCGTHSDKLERGPKHTLLEELSAPERYVSTGTSQDRGDRDAE